MEKSLPQLPPGVNPLVFESIPPAEAAYQLAHIDESRVSDIVVSHIICLVIATVAIVMRFVSRKLNKTAIQADDWMIVAALIFTIGYITSVFLCVLDYGGGRHAILLTNPIKFAQSVLAVEIFYAPAMASVKISTCLLFARIFPDRKFRHILWGVAGFVMTYSSIMILVAIFQCIPIRAAWDTTVKAKCIDLNVCFMVLAGMNVLTDFILLAAPLPKLWRLQMPNKTKYELIGIFCVGGFITIVSIYRIPKLHGLSLVDASWSNADSTIWSLVEVSVAIACACAITYRPLFNWIFRIRSSAFDGSASHDRKVSRPSAYSGGYSTDHSGSREGRQDVGMDRLKHGFGKTSIVSMPSHGPRSPRRDFERIGGDDVEAMWTSPPSDAKV